MQYWNDEQEQAVINWQNEQDTDKRNKIYTQLLHRPIQQIIRGVIVTFRLVNYNDNKKLRDALTEVESHIYENVLPMIDLNKGKAYSYITKSARWYLSAKRKYWGNNLDSIDTDVINPQLQSYNSIIITIADQLSNDDYDLMIEREELDDTMYRRSTTVDRIKWEYKTLTQRAKRWHNVCSYDYVHDRLQVIDAIKDMMCNVNCTNDHIYDNQRAMLNYIRDKYQLTASNYVIKQVLGEFNDEKNNDVDT